MEIKDQVAEGFERFDGERVLWTGSIWTQFAGLYETCTWCHI